ncbi:glycosyltransferase 61 family protein [Asticcacaulis taihuensis]|uniref:Glycosyltransferase 61 catalytic domain-containing protein n=2 Tax=Asticcacaulis taihuensis TaxID=260084 RepID=A0A1G4SEH4_9CAUL|nr:Protein of unknown function [Asticcacaulis taihuensis]
MSGSFKFEYIEHIAAESLPKQDNNYNLGFTNPDRALDFTARIPNAAPPYNPEVLLPFDKSQAITEQYLVAIHSLEFIAAGILTFSDFGFFENCALPIDLSTREALIGEPICWGSDFADWYAREHLLEELFNRQLSKSYLDKIYNGLKDHAIHGDAVILSAPGQEIYGHWLLDVIPKLHILQQSGHEDLPIYFNSLPGWATHFLNSFGISRSRIRPHPSRYFRVRRAIVPTSSKSGFRLGGNSLREAWTRISRPARVTLPSDFIGEKIFLSRGSWTQGARPSHANISDIEAAAVARGYKIVFPETLDIPQQIRLMQSARIIVGEDGSALHNIIFSEPGARLGVLSLPERTNLWHLSLCHVLGHQLSYCYGDAYGIVPLSKFNAFLDILEAQVCP